MDSRQFLAGSVAGCVGQCVGHPLDSIKVVMQTATSGAAKASPSASDKRALSAYRSAVEMYRSPYGLRSFFRGLSLPLMTKSVEQCVAFGIKGAVGNLISPLESGDEGDGSILEGLADDSYRAGISGVVAGACTAVLLTPVYLVKVQLQATTTILAASPTSSSSAALKGPIEAIRATVSRLGWRGLYTGALPTLLGSSVGYGFRFATYDKTVSWVRDRYEETGDDGDDGDDRANFRTAKILSIVLGGGLAGMATWLSHFPLDLVANRMMAEVVLSSRADPGATAGKRKGMLAQFRSIYLQQGWKGYFRGLGPCLLRAFPVNAAIFLSYEACMGDL